jgi:hypothetical protein
MIIKILMFFFLLGGVNPPLSTRSASNLPTYTGANPRFKRCTIKTVEGFNGFGFTLNSKVKPKFMVFSVDPQSPSYAANLRDQDVIVQIDRKNIRRIKFDKVKEMLRQSSQRGEVEILAISKDGYIFYKDRGQRFSNRKLVTNENVDFFSNTSAPGSAIQYNINTISSQPGIVIYFWVLLYDFFL